MDYGQATSCPRKDVFVNPVVFITMVELIENPSISVFRLCLLQDGFFSKHAKACIIDKSAKTSPETRSALLTYRYNLYILHHVDFSACSFVSFHIPPDGVL